mmetsp:Transcript_119483/g.283642  ORF Transcript_119483/g.283642 Transcript_119483/m.283642 type:complete len:91 (+) Transcript_119483:89-361(+)
MGNTLLTTHKIACGHTDRTHLQRNLLCDRLSQPTAEMVDALLFLQDHTDELAQFGKTLLRSEPGIRSAAGGARKPEAARVPSDMLWETPC